MNFRQNHHPAPPTPNFHLQTTASDPRISTVVGTGGGTGVTDCNGVEPETGLTPNSERLSNATIIRPGSAIGTERNLSTATSTSKPSSTGYFQNVVQQEPTNYPSNGKSYPPQPSHDDVAYYVGSVDTTPQSSRTEAVTRNGVIKGEGKEEFLDTFVSKNRRRSSIRDWVGDWLPSTSVTTHTSNIGYAPLSSSTLSSSPSTHLPNPTHGRSASFSFLGFISSRSRLHPLALVPTFLCGILLAMSGAFGPNFNSTQTITIGGVSRMDSYAMGGPRGSDPTGVLRADVPSLRPNYTIHSSGHLFLHPSSLDPMSVTSPISPFQAYQQAHETPRSVRHPILDLVNNATRDWEAKVKRQSKTLAQAVKEYKRRHKRNPPKGFDKWFKFAKENEVILIDEFDQTYTDVHKFWALPPEVLANRSTMIQMDPSTFTMRIKNGNVTIMGAHKKDGRATDQAGLMKRWAKLVPDVNITMSAHDGPSIMLDDKHKRLYIEAANTGKLISHAQADEVDEDPALWGFPLACPEKSRLRRACDGLELDSLPPGPGYIYDHIKTMDLCQNPEWQYLHGFTAWAGARPSILRPLFSFAKTSMHDDILLTPLEQFSDFEPWDPVWEKKAGNKAVWRGSTTGVWFDRGTWWRSSQRLRLYFMSHDQTGHQLVRFNGVGQESASGVESIAERNVSTSILMDRYVDFAFTGEITQCTEKDGSCDAVKQLIKLQDPLGWNQANEFKYLLDIDGNAWSGRFHRLLSSNSAVLKSSIFPEWYAGWIQPWYHYIPIKIDYTDLFDVMAFFSGDLDGKNAHEDLAKKIAQQGKQYTAKHWRYADMESYFFRLALEWARVTAKNRSEMDYIG